MTKPEWYKIEGNCLRVWIKITWYSSAECYNVFTVICTQWASNSELGCQFLSCVEIGTSGILVGGLRGGALWGYELDPQNFFVLTVKASLVNLKHKLWLDLSVTWVSWLDFNNCAFHYWVLITVYIVTKLEYLQVFFLWPGTGDEYRGSSHSPAKSQLEHQSRRQISKNRAALPARSRHKPWWMWKGTETF